MDSVLLGAGRLGDADVDKERRGWDAGAILGEEMDVAVACRGRVRLWLMAAPHPTLQLSPGTLWGYPGPPPPLGRSHSPGLMLANAKVNWPTKSFLEVLS